MRFHQNLRAEPVSVVYDRLQKVAKGLVVLFFVTMFILVCFVWQGIFHAQPRWQLWVELILVVLMICEEIVIKKWHKDLSYAVVSIVQTDFDFDWYMSFVRASAEKPMKPLSRAKFETTLRFTQANFAYMKGDFEEALNMLSTVNVNVFSPKQYRATLANRDALGFYSAMFLRRGEVMDYYYAERRNLVANGRKQTKIKNETLRLFTARANALSGMVVTEPLYSTMQDTKRPIAFLSMNTLYFEAISATNAGDYRSAQSKFQEVISLAHNNQLLFLVRDAQSRLDAITTHTA